MIKRAEVADSKIVAELAMSLWPDNGINDLEKEMMEYIVSDKRAVFISFSENSLVGFIQAVYEMIMLKERKAVLLDIWKVFL